MIEYSPQILSWLFISIFLILGLVGAVVPIIPSHLMILIAGIIHYSILKEQSGLGVVSFIILTVMLIGSQLCETLSGSVGSKWFGGSKWGPIGALSGMLVGLFFPPFGFLLGPLLGAAGFELIWGKKSLKDATSSGIGSAVGTLTGLTIRLIVSILMAIYLLLDILLFK